MVPMGMRSFFEKVFWTVIISGILFVSVQEKRIQSALDHFARPVQLFSPNIVTNTISPRPEWDVVQSKDRHKFFYVASQAIGTWMGKGENCCTFNFANDRYVIKLVRFDARKKEPGFLKRLIHYGRQEKPSPRLQEALYSAKLSVEELAAQTGVTYVHLNPTRDLVANIKVRDFFGQEFRLFGDGVCFVVQEKAVPFIKKISMLMNGEDVDGAKRHIDRVVDLYVSLARKGYVQRDGLNVGFVGDRAIFMDVWHFEKASRCPFRERIAYDARETLRPIESWLVATHPVLGEYYQNRIQCLIAETNKASEAKLG
jgi:hypothetical protein